MYTQALNVTNRAGNSGTLIFYYRKYFCITNSFINIAPETKTL